MYVINNFNSFIKIKLFLPETVKLIVGVCKGNISILLIQKFEVFIFYSGSVIGMFHYLEFN